MLFRSSSQALKLDRTYGINFDVALFTNFSPDHICEGEHASLDEYRKCKQILFTQCKKGIFNIDDESAELFMETSVCDDIITYGTTKEAQLSAFNINQWSCDGKLGVEFDVSGIMNSHISLEIPGDFNAYNAMAAMATCLCFSINPEVICSVLSQVRILGRVELVPVSNQFSVIIDYAHNEVSTRSVLETLRSYQPMHIICVYGGGGNRAKIRRYDMGEVTGELADLSILTCDNPRDEEISNINKDIIVGLDKHKGKYIEIEDRTDAIEYAIRHAELGDIILLLGKGHEDYQEIKGTKYHYTEKEAIFEAASRLE